MRNLALMTSGLLLLVGIGGLVVFFISIGKIGTGISVSEVLPYLLSLLPLLYSIYLFSKIKKEDDFVYKHKVAMHLLIWPAILSSIIAVAMLVFALVAGEGLGIFFAVFVILAGTILGTVLSLLSILFSRFQS